jgi:hypothetical protein
MNSPFFGQRDDDPATAGLPLADGHPFSLVVAVWRGGTGGLSGAAGAVDLIPSELSGSVQDVYMAPSDN